MLPCILAVLAAATAALVAGRALGARTVVELALSAWTVAVAVLAAVGVFLAENDRLTPWWLAGTTVVVAAGLAAATRSRPWPPLAPIRPALRDAARPAVLVLAVVSGGVLVVSFGLAVLTPAAEADALAYHLARAAFWIQQHGFDPVAGLRDPRIDGSPPVPAILAVLGLSIAGTAGAALIQWSATALLGIAVYGIARRLGSPRPAAALAGLAVPALPIVALQAPTALTDTLLACLVAVAAYAALDARPGSSLLLSVAVALAIATKLTAAPGLAIVVLLAATAMRGRARARHIAAIGAGGLVGAVTVLFQRSDVGGSTVGGQPSDLAASGGPVAFVARASRLLLDAVELPGAVGRDTLVPVLVGAAMAGVALLVRRGRRPLALAGALVALVGLVPILRDALDHGYRKAWVVLGEEDLSLLGFPRDGTAVSSVESWSGVVGAVVLGIGVVVGVGALRARSLPRAILALAPLTWLVLLAGLADYTPAAGRYSIGAFALALAACAPILEREVPAWWLVGASAVASTLALVHSQERPLGVRLLEPVTAPSAWTRPDADAMGASRGMAEILRAVDGFVPDDATLAIWAYPFPEPEPQPGVVVLYPYPFFGEGLQRRVTLVRNPTDATSSGAGWAVLPAWALPACVDGWERATSGGGPWQLLRRSAGTTC